MNLSIKHLALNSYTHCEDEVPEGHMYGFWRIVEHTGAGWFPWPTRYTSKEAAEKALLSYEKR
jgi:hypothetical protein